MPDAAYSVKALARLTGANVAQLRRWARSGLLPADTQLDGQLRYRFADVIAARAARTLIDQGLTTRQVREAVEAIRAWRPDVPNPLTSLRVFNRSGRLVIRVDDRLMEPQSGQLLLNLSLSETPPAVVHMLPTPAPIDADEWISRAHQAQQMDNPVEVIQHAFSRALALEPEHPGALIGLGNLKFERGELLEAKDLYKRATLVASEHPHPWYNLANVLDDLGAVDAAASAYTTALDRDPDYGDAHFNLALLWEKHGQHERARPHWLRVIDLLPATQSAHLAQRFLLEGQRA